MNGYLLLDIEGTVAPIAFVKEQLFPYARRVLPEFVRQYGDQPEVRHWLEQAAADMNAPENDTELVAGLQQWIDEDRKHTALKALQGMLWKTGYEQGQYRTPMYTDAIDYIRSWHASRRRIGIYSSGSVPAQKLLFRYSDSGDLNPLISDYFDTEIGAKKDPASYQNIAMRLDIEPARVLFCSDDSTELDAAHATGLQTVFVDRRQDYPQPRHHDERRHMRITTFTELPAPAILI